MKEKIILKPIQTQLNLLRLVIFSCDNIKIDMLKHDMKGYIMLILSIPQTQIQVYSPTEVITNKSIQMLPTCSKRISSRQSIYFFSDT